MGGHHILVIGAGSVGKRHLRNLSSLGCRVSAFDPRPDRLAEAAELVPLVATYSDLQAALAKGSDLAGVAICSPPKFHVEQACEALNRNLPVLLEKPVSPDAQSAARLVEVVEKSARPLLLSYTYRWWPPLREFKARLDQGVVGKVRHVRCVMSAHLADWHPWERYQDFFMSSKELGGGALLDESHVLDLILWIFGMPKDVYAKVEHLSTLEIETDDHVDAWFGYSSGLAVSVHLDLYGRPHERSITVVGEQGTMQWSYEDNCLRVGRTATGDWEETRYQCERNDMFLEVAKEFLGIVEAKQSPSCSIQDGHAVLQLIEKMRRSSMSGRMMPMEISHV